MPTQALHIVLLVVLFDVVGLDFATAVFDEPAFQEGVGQVEVDGGHQFVDHLVEEDGVGLGFVLFLHLGFDGLLEFVEFFDFLVGEDLLEEVLVEFGFLVADGIVDDDVVVAVDRSVFAQNFGHGFFAVEGFGEVDDELGADFLADDHLTAFLVLDLVHVDEEAVLLEATFQLLAVFGFAHLQFEAVVLAHGLRMAGVGVALLQVFDHLVHFLVGGDDMVEVDHRVGVVDVDFGTQCGLKVEVDVLFLVEVGRLLLVKVAERIADQVEFVVHDMLVEAVGDHRVEGFHFCAGAIHLFDHAHGHHAGAETGHIGAATHIFQGLFNGLLVVGFLDANLDGDQVVSFRALCDVHFYMIDYL